MAIRIWFTSILLIGLFLVGTGASVRIGFAEVLIISSASGILLMSEQLQWRRRVNAVEQFLTRVHRTPTRSTKRSRILQVDSTIDECADRLRFHLSTIIGERHPKSSPKHHDYVRDLIAGHMKDMGWDVRLEPVKGPQ